MPAVPPPTVAGWREWVGLPDLGVDWIKAKFDTGARTSALRVLEPEEYAVDGESWVRFGIAPWQGSEDDVIAVDTPVLDRRLVRSSSGHSEERLVVATTLRLLGEDRPIELTLSSRDEMGFRLLVGREALGQGVLVNSAESYLGGRPRLAVRRRNRGRV